ncbi:hypothetical protein C479_11865 [Halovivax asiaticus JCM 14624]|uniref:Uncharacterized protein n=1 Tax=Halovivax asiaticus JCM 14624 TaxID=1227490 RepID=M0BGW7_9EURY|nr:hypothetical protein [Halovivax asiaticus]ELZ09513.1 hypothetical protein C479_11865 [Halovivax asiaticus JCM 14624]
MAVRCSLLGHDFGATEVEREREERGSEVVVTVTEYESCTRCGERTVISENTEVRGIEPADDPEPATAAGAASESVDDATAPAESTPAADSETPAGDSRPSEPESEPLPTDEHGEPITDDAEILDEPAAEPTAEADRDRAHGAWPDSDDVGQDDASDKPTEWPAAASDETAAPEADPIDEGGSPEAVSTAADRETATATSGIQRAGTAPAPGETGPRDDVPVEFFCPRCSFVAPGDRSSLRAGDICPECKKGYLGERER